MTGGIDKIQHIIFPVPGPVGQGDRLAFNGDAPFPFVSILSRIWSWKVRESTTPVN